MPEPIEGRVSSLPYTPSPCTSPCWTPQECDTCGREQQPTGRSVALEASGGYCDRERCPDRPVAVRHLWDEHDPERWRFDPEGEKQHQAECDRCRPEDDDE